MDKRYRHLLRATLAALPLACAAVLSSCAFDDDVAECPDPNAPATVRVSVSAGEPGDLNGTRAGDDVNADEHEFMHTLYLYIVDESGVVKKAFLNPLANYDLAKTGDLTNWDSEEFTLTPGDYTIYAFSNIDKYEGKTNNASDNGYDFINTVFHEGYQTQNGGDVEEFRLLDPASKINFANGMYIPMSAKKEITVTPNTSDISIGLDRLVSKVKITVPDNQYISTNSTIQFSGYAENVPLLGADSGYGSAELYGGRTATTDEMLFNQAGQEVSFYVNETHDGDPFTVTLNTGKSGNGDISKYVAKTQRTDIPRNSIYPLSLTFPEFGFSLTPTAWLYVTGVPYAVYYNVGINNVLTVEIATGSYFNFAPGNMSDSKGEYSTTWSWTVPEQQYEGLSTEISQNEIQGNVPAGQGLGNKYTLYLNGKWTASDGHSYDRTYTVIVDVCHDETWALANRIQGGTTTRGAKSGKSVYMLAPEHLNMFKTK